MATTPPPPTGPDSSDTSSPSPPSSSPRHREVFPFSFTGQPTGAPIGQSSKESEARKVRGFFGKLGTHKREPSSSSLSSSDGKTLPAPPSDTSVTPSISKEPLNVHVKQSTFTSSAPHNDERFQQSVASAQRTINRLSTVNAVLTGIGAGLSLGAGWMPGVAEGVKLVLQMLDLAKKISVGKVAALRLVERSAAVLAAVEQAVIDARGIVSSTMEANINQLLGNIHATSYILTKQADRPFLKLYLRATDSAGEIAKATEDLQDFIVLFQLQTQISSAAWQEQSRLDHQHDLEILYQRLDEGRKDDHAMLTLLQMKAEEQQEAIKTLQRTLDRLLALQETKFAENRPGSSLLLADSVTRSDSPDEHPLASIQRNLTEEIPFMTLGVRARPWDPLSSDVGQEDRSGLNSNDHREFCERALDVLRRNSAGSDTGVPDWTITSLEVAHDERISSGFYSVVWRGRWQGQEVAIKELNSTTDRILFIKEVEVWRKLRDSAFILPFLGASSTTGPPPWFLVSPYMRNGNILSYLRSNVGSQSSKVALVHQIAQGMGYLHSRDIVHGDFKAANVLITDIGQSVICDFGLSHIKLDITTRSHDEPAAQHALAGTLRWQSPERLAGGGPTTQSDVYAFAMTVFEVFTGQVPFGYIDDNVLRDLIQKGKRPDRPASMSDALWKLVTTCWAPDPKQRPTFEQISKVVEGLYNAQQTIDRQGSQYTTSSGQTFVTASEGVFSDEQRAISPQSNVIPLPDVRDDGSSSSGSLRSIPAYLEDELSLESDRAERHYRHYLSHGFDDRLTLPLWFPSVIPLGTVGYVRHGQFIKLMDAHHPPLDYTNLPPMPYLDEFSSLQTSKIPVNVRNAAERGFDFVNAFTHFIRSSGETSMRAISRRISYPLKPGMKQAALVVDDGVFEIYKSFAEARSYLSANINWILQHFGDSHSIRKEDVIIVVGTLTAHNYAMIVSNFAPRTTLSFNVHANPEPKEHWGTWSVNRQPPSADASKAFRSPTTSAIIASEEEIGSISRAGPDEQELKYTCRVSTVSASPMEAVILAKLKFPPAGADPTLYP